MTSQAALRRRRQRDQLPVRLRRRPRLQRPDPVADQLHLRRPARRPAAKGAGVNAGGVRAVRLPALGHRHLGEARSTARATRRTLSNVNVDGGPLDPVCPAGDTCPPSFNGYAGDIEVEADIETQLADRAGLSTLIVYNAPNDETGQTELDEYTAIANEDRADSVSSSWGVCENDVGAGLRPGGEHRLRADGAAGPEHVRRLGRHRGVRLHPLRRHDDRQRATTRRPSRG